MFHRSCILIFVLFILGPKFSSAQPHSMPLSERVGSVISVEERDYFNLFHRYPQFKEASFYTLGDSLRLLDITSVRDGIEVVQRDTLTLEVFGELSRYVTHFEELYKNTRDVNWGFIIPYAGPKRWKHKRGKAFVKLLDGKKYEGRLVYIDSHHMLLTPSKQTLPYLPETRLHKIDFSAIETLRFRFGPIQALLHGIEDILFFSKTRYIFGNQDRYEKQVASPLMGQEIFPHTYPPELDAAKSIAPVAMTADPSLAEERYLESINHQWVFKISSHVPVFRSTDAFRFTSINQDHGKRKLWMTNVSLQASFSKHISRKVRLGGVVQYYPSSRLSTVTYSDPVTSVPLPLKQRDFSQIQLSGISFIPAISYQIAAPNKKRFALDRDIALLDRFELTASLGPSFSQFTSNTSVTPDDVPLLYTGYLVQIHSFSWDNFVIGGLAQLDFHFFPREYISIGLTGEYLAFPLKSVDLATLENPLQEGLNYEAKSLVADSDLFSQISMYLSLRLHF